MAIYAGVYCPDDIYDIIVGTACRHNQPPGLALSLALHESTFNPRAVSYYQHCCKGLYQFKNEGEGGGLGMGYTDEQLFDPAFNAELAMSYMEQNGGMESILANVNPWESGPLALATWKLMGTDYPSCPDTGTGGGNNNGGGSNPPANPSTGNGGNAPSGGTGFPPYGDSGSTGSGPTQAYPASFADLGNLLTNLPSLLKYGAANFAVLMAATVAFIIGAYLVVTAGTGIDEKDIVKTAAKAAAAAA